jgi:hypothetical protein
MHVIRMLGGALVKVLRHRADLPLLHDAGWMAGKLSQLAGAAWWQSTNEYQMAGGWELFGVCGRGGEWVKTCDAVIRWGARKNRTGMVGMEVMEVCRRGSYLEDSR